MTTSNIPALSVMQTHVEILYFKLRFFGQHSFVVIGQSDTKIHTII